MPLDPPTPSGAAAEAAATVARPKPRLFLADDSRTMRTYYNALFAGEFEVTMFDDGAPLLEAVKQAPPEVIVSDVNMPELGGLELVRLLKQDPALRPIPVILLTVAEHGTEPGQGGSVECLEAGADDYLQKPFKREELMARVRSAHRGFDLYRALERKHDELGSAYLRLAEMEIELRQAQKLESVGRLAAGLAHEINTPIQFVSDSLTFARDTVRSLAELVPRYRQAVAQAADGPLDPDTLEALTAAEEDADLDYALKETPRALERALSGSARVAGIVQAMKSFGREDVTARSHADLNAALRATLEVARSEYSATADVETAFGEIPAVLCQAGPLNQVFLHLITNAAHAIADKVAAAGGRGRITISTSREGDGVRITVADDGTGIPAEARDRVFDPFFTTKDVGRGSGQGLTIARSIVEKHGGTIRFETETGRGTTFHVYLPENGMAPVAGVAAAPVKGP